MRKLTELVRRFTNWCSTHKAVTALMMAVLVLSIPLHYTHAAGELFTQFLNNPIDTTMITLAGIIQVITGAVGKMILLIIQVVVIPVLGYNGFYNSHITNLGWSLVRDVVNMFVVVILMVIAIMTIVGYSAANWTQQLPKLFIAIVLVNFSKLICGFLIDVSQVIMFTFVNAIVSIAAGNFASMLSLNTFGQFGSDFIDKINETGTGLEAFEFLMGAYLQFIVMLAILGVMFLLAVAFVWRIVILWILIIMSPLAFFMIGVKDVFHAADSSYKQWWGKFTSALTFGPTMVFFLWLALAASSGSNLAQTEDFPMPESQGDAGIPLEMFSLDNFLGMFLALAILLAGMQQASSAASGMGGFASSMLSEQNGIGMAKWLAKSPFRAAGGFKKERAWVNDKAQKGAAYTAGIAPGLTKSVGTGMAKVGTAAAGVKGLGWAGNAVAAAGGNIVKGAKHTMKDEAKLGGEQLKERTDDQMARIDAAAAIGGNNFESLPPDEKNAYLKNFGTDQKRRDKFKANQEKSLVGTKHPLTGAILDAAGAKVEAQRQHDLLFQSSAKFLDNAGKDLMDDTEKDRFQDSKFANMHLLGTDAEREKVWAAQEKDGRLNLGLLSNGALTAPATATMTSTAAFLRSKISRRDDKGKDITAFDDIVSHGKGTPAQRDALISTIGAPDVSKIGTPDEKKSSAQNVAALVNTNRIPKMSAATDKPLMDAMRDNLGSLGTDLAPEVQGKATAQLIESGAYGATPDAVRDVLKIPASGYPSAADVAVTGAVDAKLATIPPADRDAMLERVDNVIESDASNAALFDHLVPSAADLPTSTSDPVKANEITKRIASVSASDIDSLYKAEPGASPKAIARKKQALSTIDRAVSAQLHVEDQRAQAADRLRKTQQDAKAATAALAVATANQAAAIAENSAATAAVAGKATRPPAEHAAIDQRAATAAAEMTRATTFTAAAAAAEAAALAAVPAAQADVTRLGKENKREMKRLADLHAKIKNTAVTTGRYTPTT